MKINVKHIIPLLLIVGVLASLAFASTVIAQFSGTAGSSMTVTRTPYLSIDSTPSSFSFPSINTRATERDIFSNDNGPLPNDKLIRITDARNSGGFVLQAQASDFSDNGNIIPASLLRVITTSDINEDPAGTNEGNVLYLNSFSGSKNIATPLNAGTSDFGQVATFNDVEDLTQNISLNNPVDLLNGCLPATKGRLGTMAVGLAFTLNVPAYTVPGNYNATITYTIIDSTGETCP